MMNDKYTIINQAGDFRIFLHRLLLLNSGVRETLKRYIDQEFESSNIEYTEWQTFQIKIKKSNLKKKNFTHTIDFYYNHIDMIIYRFLNDSVVESIIYADLAGCRESRELIETLTDIKSQSINCRCLYSITTAEDGVVELNI